MVGTAGLQAALQLLEVAGIDTIWHHVDRLCDHLVTGLEAIDGVHVLSDRTPEGRSSIVTFVADGFDGEALRDVLKQKRFMCAPRAGGVRVAPHGYNSFDEIDAFAAEVAAQV